MRKRTLRIIIITLSVLLAFFILAGWFVCNQTPEPFPPEPTPEATRQTPSPTPEIVEIVGLRILLENDVVVLGTRFWPEVIIQPYNATDKSYDLVSDNERIVRPQGNTWVAAGIGTANLVVTTSGGMTATAAITVVAPELESMSFRDDEITLHIEDHIDAELVFVPMDVNVEGKISFTSANDRIATVTNEGRITAVGVGNTTITARVGDITADLRVIVVVPIRSITVSVDRDSRVYSVGEQVQIRIQVEPENASNASVAISFSGARVTHATGSNTFTCEEAGEVIITFTAESGSQTQINVIVHDLAALADEVYRLTNRERANAQHPIPPLGRLAPLTEVAQLRTGEIIVRMEHVRPDGREFQTILDDYNVEYLLAGENLAAGQRSPAEVVRAWMESEDGHRENILNPEYGHIGIGVAMDNTGRLYWVQLFMD